MQVLPDGQGRFEVGDPADVRERADPADGRRPFRQPGRSTAAVPSVALIRPVSASNRLVRPEPDAP
ncbi:hypothetical protein SALBM311S_02234 [Streptomyces alboniger]